MQDIFCELTFFYIIFNVPVADYRKIGKLIYYSQKVDSRVYCFRKTQHRAAKTLMNHGDGSDLEKSSVSFTRCFCTGLCFTSGQNGPVCHVPGGDPGKED